MAVRFRPFPEEPMPTMSLTPTTTGLRPQHLLPTHQTEKAWSVQEQTENQTKTSLSSTTLVTQKGVVRKVPGRNVFAMDAVFDVGEETRTVYHEMVKPIVLSAANGQHGTVFVYGQTGSGKTFTMQGGDLDPFIGSRPKGLIQMAAADLFDRIEATGTRNWVIKASFFEVYNEEVRDLLVSDDNDSLSSSCSHSCLPVLTIREDQSGNVRVKAHQEVVTSLKDVVRVLHKGNAHRACGATAKNSRSSRSHAIFRLHIESRSKSLSDNDSNTVRTSILNLVDLAGSENGNTSSPARRREGCKINQSLLALTRIIQSLGLPESKRPKHIGYRDSKLTRILKQSLEGDACMSVICCASPLRVDVEETRSTLKFAASAKRIQIHPAINEVKDCAVTMLKSELTSLKEAMAMLQQKYALQEMERNRRARALEGIPCLITPPISQVPTTRRYPYDETSGDAESEETPKEFLEHSTQDSSDDPPPPVKEVEVVMGAPQVVERHRSEAEERAQFLQSKLNESYDVVASLVQELSQARGLIQKVHGQNMQLQERLCAIEEEICAQKKTGESSPPFTSWMYALALFFYAFEMNQFVAAGMLYMFLSQNFVASDVIQASSSGKKEENKVCDFV